MPSFDVSRDIDLGPKTVLRRHLDLPKFLDLLHTQSFYLRRADGFSDRLEGALFPSHRGYIDRAHAAGSRSLSADEYYRRVRTGNYVSCWTRGSRDSMALWQLYGGQSPSVAVTTTVERLVEAALSWRRHSIIHRVKYVEHAKVRTFVVGRYSDMLQYKHVAYKHESEVRLIIPQQGDGWESNPMSIRLPIHDMNKLIRSVVVSPESSPEFLHAIADLARKYGLRSKVLRSTLANASV